MNTITQIMKHLEIDGDVPALLQTIVVEPDGKEHRIPPYVLIFIYKYWDDMWRKAVFGHLYDYDDLLQEMLLELIKAAGEYDSTINDSFISYLKPRLHNRLLNLMKYHARREGKIPTESLEAVLQDFAEETYRDNDYEGESVAYPERLIASDVAEEAAGIFLVQEFLAALPVRQRLVALIKMGEVEQLAQDSSQMEIARFLHTSQKTISQDLTGVKEMFVRYAQTSNPGWLYFVKKFLSKEVK